MRIDIITAFPKMFISPFNESIVKIAQDKSYLELSVHDLRNYSDDKHKKVDDSPYGGGPGMVMKPEPFFKAVESVKKYDEALVVLLTPQGTPLKQQKVDKLAQSSQLILLCGHYEGVDERVRKFLATEEISVGDYVLTGGELPAMVLVDAITRKLAGVLGSQESLTEESFRQGLLEYPHYTRPAEFRGMEVPEVLLSGNHDEIARWRKEQAIKRTRKRRPDLLRSSEQRGN